jgi:hypothetical protein
LSEPEYRELERVLYRKPTFDDAFTFDQYIEQKRSTENVLRQNLSKRWARVEDFEVGEMRTMRLRFAAESTTQG